MILITGIKGFLGRCLEEFLQNQKIEYIGIAHGTEFKKEQGIYYMDLTNEEHIIKLSKDLSGSIDTIIHLAGYININIVSNEYEELTAGEENIHELYKNNVLSCANLIKLCNVKHIKHFVFASSQTIYGFQGMNCQYTEKSAEKPIEHYACSKLCCEKMLEIYSKSGADVTILRFCGLWGHEKRNEFVTDMIKEAIKTKSIDANFPIPLPLDLIHVDEAVKAISYVIKSIKNGFNIYNIATGEPCSTEVLANMIANEFSDVKVIKPKVNQPIITMDITKFKKDFGYTPNSNKNYIIKTIGEMMNAE